MDRQTDSIVSTHIDKRTCVRGWKWKSEKKSQKPEKKKKKQKERAQLGGNEPDDTSVNGRVNHHSA